MEDKGTLVRGASRFTLSTPVVKGLLWLILVATVMYNGANYLEMLSLKSTRLFPDDLQQLLAGAHALRNGVPLYGPDFQPFATSLGFRQLPPPLGPPAIYALFVPLTPFSLLNATRVYLLLNHILLFISFGILTMSFATVYRMSIRRQLIWTSAMSVCALCYSPVLDTFIQGQTNIIVLFFTSLALYASLRRAEVVAGLAISLAIIVKLVPVIFLAYFLVRRRYVAAITGLSAYFVFNLAVGLIFGMHDLIAYPAIFARSLLPMPSFEDQGVSSLLTYLLHNKTLELLLFGIIAVGSLVATLRYAYTRDDEAGTLSVFALLVLVSCLVSSHSYAHHHVILLMPFALAFLYLSETDSGAPSSDSSGRSPALLSLVLMSIYLIFACLDGFVTRDPVRQQWLRAVMEHHVMGALLPCTWLILVEATVHERLWLHRDRAAE